MTKCRIKIFIGGGGVVQGWWVTVKVVVGDSERCLKPGMVVGVEGH